MRIGARQRSIWWSPLLLLVFLSPAYGQPADSTAAQRPHALEKGRWALKFGVGGRLFNLCSFEGSTLSAKLHSADNQAWQIGLTLGSRFHKQTVQQETTQESNLQTVVVDSRYLVYPRLKDRGQETVHLYLGAGPRFSLDRTHTESRPPDEDVRTTVRWTAGISAGVGAEWFPHPRISLLGEYNSALRYRRDRSVREAREPTERVNTSVNLQPEGARLGISVYF